jgi:hypothetical protein
VRAGRQSFKRIVELWVELFSGHDLLTYASAIGPRSRRKLLPLVAGVSGGESA